MLRWWRSVVNFSFFRCLAACRTRSSAWVTRTRLRVRRVLCSLAFLSVPPWPHDSAAVAPALFVGFTATTAVPDFSRWCIIGCGSSPSRCGPEQHAAPLLLVDREISRFPNKKRLHMPVSVTTPDRLGARDGAPVHVAFHIRNCVGIRDEGFRGSMAGLCSPLPTLGRCPRGRLPTARGRCGSLLLHREGLAPSTSCRFRRRTPKPSHKPTYQRPIEETLARSRLVSDDARWRSTPLLATASCLRISDGCTVGFREGLGIPSARRRSRQRLCLNQSAARSPSVAASDRWPSLGAQESRGS